MQCALALALVLGAAACGDDSAADKANGGETDHDHKETPKDLERVAGELFSAVAKGDDARAKAIAESLRLLEPVAWFSAHFGDERGESLAAEYAPAAAQLEQLAALFGELAANGQTEIAVERFTEPGDAASVGYQSIALEAMKDATPLYSLRIRKPGADDVFHLWSFVYADGFRWVGKLRSLSGEPPADPDLLEFRIRDAARAARAHVTDEDGDDKGE